MELPGYTGKTVHMKRELREHIPIYIYRKSHFAHSIVYLLSAVGNMEGFMMEL